LDIHPIVVKYLGTNIKAFDRFAAKFANNHNTDWEPGLEYTDDWDN